MELVKFLSDNDSDELNSRHGTRTFGRNLSSEHSMIMDGAQDLEDTPSTREVTRVKSLKAVPRRTYVSELQRALFPFGEDL